MPTHEVIQKNEISHALTAPTFIPDAALWVIVIMCQQISFADRLCDGQRYVIMESGPDLIRLGEREGCPGESRRPEPKGLRAFCEASFSCISHSKHHYGWETCR